MTDSNGYLTPFFHYYDCMAWVPTIRGSLSLDLFGISGSPLCDADGYSVEFKVTEDFHSSRYLAATSLFTFNDSKYHKEYVRTFRFVFRGAIHDKQKQKEYLQSTLIKASPEDIDQILENEELLIGRLSIITVENSLSEAEVEAINLFQQLESQKAEYNELFFVKADSLQRLYEASLSMKQTWIDLEQCLIMIEKSGTNDLPVYNFELALSRDGFLFLKDGTNPSFHKHYREEHSRDDFTENKQIHRIFKTALHYVKFLFHTNYHHRVEHDTLLPASNLHSLKQDQNLEKIARHQLDAFLNPIAKLKRNHFTDYSCEPIGIALYVESFLHLVEQRKILPQVVAENYRSLLLVQKEEIGLLSEEIKATIPHFLTQKNALSYITICSAFLLTAVEISTTVFGYNFFKKNTNNEPDMVSFFVSISIILGSIFMGYLLKYYTETKALSKRYIRTNTIRKRSRILNSNLEKKELSHTYRFKRYLISTWYRSLRAMTIDKTKKESSEKLLILKNQMGMALLILFIALVALLYHIFVLKKFGVS